jgi:hypothetical protein
VTVVWVGPDGDEIVAAHLPEHRKVRNIRNDSRVALSIETDTRNAMASTSTSSYMARRALPREELPSSFSNSLTPHPGPEVRFRSMDNPHPDITHISVDRVAGVGPWAEQH